MVAEADDFAAWHASFGESKRADHALLPFGMTEMVLTYNLRQTLG